MLLRKSLLSMLFLVVLLITACSNESGNIIYNGNYYDAILTSSELEQELYRVDSYAEDLSSSKYYVHYIKVEPPTKSDGVTQMDKFNDLCNIVRDTPFSYASSYQLADGVNCQTMTVYIADWCKLNGFQFSIKYADNHVYIIVYVDSHAYRIDFNMSTVIEEVIT